MARSLFWLSDEAWKALEPLLPHGKPGKPRVDDRTVISGILHVLKTGCRWRDVPPAFGPPTTIYNRYNRWSQRRWSEDEKRALVAETFVDGQTVNGVARRHNISRSMLFGWRKQYCETDFAAPASTPISFTPVTIARSEPG